MDINLFKSSLSNSLPPSNISVYLKALWFEANNDWNKAHELIQDILSKEAYWIHAYLHRKEGDLGNADYWYSKAGRRRPEESTKEEWEDLVEHFLKNESLY